MIKRAPSRTQRSKGFRVKHVLQICLLLGVCFWLIYQVKHAHDKKKEFDDKDAKVSVKARSDDEILKLGRKDLPQVQEAAKNEKHEDEEEDAVEEEENKPEEEEKNIREREEETDAVEEQEEANKHDEEEHEDGENEHEDEEQEQKNKNEEEAEEEVEEAEEAAGKHEEKEQEEENNNEETEDERRGGGDDELDEQDQERTEGEADREDELIDEEKEREGDGDDRESGGNEGGEKNSQIEIENSLDDHDREGVDRNTHVAREEHYKADDASSAVSHDNQSTISETEKDTSENSNVNSQRNVLEEENKSNTTIEISGNQKNLELKLGEGEMAESGSTLNVTTTEEKDHWAGSYNSEDRLPLTAINTTTEGSTGISNNSTGLSTETAGSSVQNGTETKLDTDQTPAQNVTLDGAINIEVTDLQTPGLEQANNSNTASNNNQFDSNTTTSTKTMDADAGMKDSFNISAPALSETVIRLNATADGEVSSSSSAMKKTADTSQNVTSNIDSESRETNERSDSSSTNEIVEAAKEDLVDSSGSSILQDEKESGIDLGALPDITAEVDNSEEAAAE